MNENKYIEGTLVRLWNKYFKEVENMPESPDLYILRGNLPYQVWFTTPVSIGYQRDFAKWLPKEDAREISITHLGSWASSVQPYLKGWTVFIVRDERRN